MAEDVIAIQLQCTKLPGIRFVDGQDPARPVKDPVYLGIQVGKEVKQRTPGNKRRATLTAEIKVRGKPATPDFGGPYVHGPKGGRFLYLSWGVLEGDDFQMFRRAKIILGEIPVASVREAVAAGKPIVAQLVLTDAKGGPLCARVRPPYVTWQA